MIDLRVWFNANSLTISLSLSLFFRRLKELTQQQQTILEFAVELSQYEEDWIWQLHKNFSDDERKRLRSTFIFLRRKSIKLKKKTFASCRKRTRRQFLCRKNFVSQSHFPDDDHDDCCWSGSWQIPYTLIFETSLGWRSFETLLFLILPHLHHHHPHRPHHDLKGE